MSTYLELVQRTKRESGRSGAAVTTVATGNADDLRIAAWVADAWAEVQREPHDWRWMRATGLGALVASQQSYIATDLTLTGVEEWRPPSPGYSPSVYPPGEPEREVRLHWLPYDSFRSRYIMATHNEAQPRHWTIFPDGKIAFGPTPDAAYVVRVDYQRTVTVLAADADEPDMPAQFHAMLMWRALAELALYDAASEVYTRAMGNYAALHYDLVLKQSHPIEHAADPL